MKDTVTQARQEREKQGLWETEVSYGGEVDLHHHLTCCDKNAGHQKFIPVDQFHVNYLPPGCQDNSLVDFVRAMSDLTVRVSVKYVSDSRPETVPGSDEPFPCYKNRGRNMMRTGTGWVRSVDIYPDKYEKRYTTCKCEECVNSPTPKSEFAHINIRTAAHVVCDDLEAAHTTCHLFFDKGKSPEFCSTVVTLSGLSFVWCDLERDWCYVRYVTHDLDLAYRLNTILTHKFLNVCMEPKYNHFLSTKPNLSWEEQLQLYTLSHKTSLSSPTIIVSHPHGCSKQVSFGRCTNVEERQNGVMKFTYNTPTCPGSSGALVCVMSMAERSVYDGFVHSGGQCEGEGSQQLNFAACRHYIF